MSWQDSPIYSRDDGSTGVDKFIGQHTWDNS